MAYLDLKIITREFPCILNDESGAMEYIERLTDGGGCVSQLLSLPEQDDVTADLVKLIEFQSEHRHATNPRENGMSLLCEVVNEALKNDNHVAKHLINRLYVRGYFKDLGTAVLAYYSATVSEVVEMKCDVPLSGLLSKSNSTVVICSYAMKLLAERLELIRHGKHCYLRFRCIKDYNVTLSVVILFLKSVIYDKEHDTAVQLFHPRSSTRVPLKMQLMFIDVMHRTYVERDVHKNPGGHAAEEPETCDVAHKVNTVTKEATSGQPCINKEAHAEIKDSHRDEIPCIAYKLLEKLSILWAQRDGGGDCNLDLITIAVCIVKILKCFPMHNTVQEKGLQRVQILLTEGINDRLTSFNADVNTTAMYLAATLAQWENTRQKHMGMDDIDFQFDEVEVPNREPITYLLAGQSSFVVGDIKDLCDKAEVYLKATLQDGNDLMCAKSTGKAEFHADGTGMKQGNSDATIGVEPSLAEQKQREALLEQLFVDVNPPEFLTQPIVNRKEATEPPGHIQQCYERLKGIGVVGDVEAAKMLNRDINKPREMSNQLKRELIAQTLLYLPGVVEKNEAILSRFAVPVAQMLLKLPDIEQYDDALHDIRRGLNLGLPVAEEGTKHGPLELFADNYGQIELVTTQHLVYASLLCLTVMRPLEMFEYLCLGVVDSEYSVTQQVTMLLCMQYAAKRLKSQTTYKELTDNMVMNMQGLQPLTGKKEYLVSRKAVTRKGAQPKINAILMPWERTANSNDTIVLSSKGRYLDLADNEISTSSQRRTGSYQKGVSRLVEEIHGNGNLNGGASVIQVAHVKVAVKETAVNKFRDLSNMAISHILKACETRLGKDLKKVAASPSDVVTIGALETLDVFLKCSGGRVAPSLISQCKQTVAAAYRMAHKADMLEMLARLIQQLESM